eukprot:SAG31_NODE_65_length_28565_cov_8.402914_31_plen_242_part_00
MQLGAYYGPLVSRRRCRWSRCRRSPPRPRRCWCPVPSAVFGVQQPTTAPPTSRTPLRSAAGRCNSAGDRGRRGGGGAQTAALAACQPQRMSAMDTDDSAAHAAQSSVPSSGKDCYFLDFYGTSLAESPMCAPRKPGLIEKVSPCRHQGFGADGESAGLGALFRIPSRDTNLPMLSYTPGVPDLNWLGTPTSSMLSYTSAVPDSNSGHQPPLQLSITSAVPDQHSGRRREIWLLLGPSQLFR